MQFRLRLRTVIVVGVALSGVLLWRLAFSYPVRVQVQDLPWPVERLTGTLRFGAGEARYWFTSKYGYYEVAGRERGWRWLEEMGRGDPGAIVVVRLHGIGLVGRISVPGQADLLVLVGVNHDRFLWRAAKGWVRVARTRHGEALTASVSLQRLEPPLDASRSAAGGSEEMLRVSGVDTAADIGTPINIFVHVGQRDLPGLKDWLDDDPELRTLLPANLSTR